MRSRSRILGTCHVCGKKCWGRVIFTAGARTRYRRTKGVIVRDDEGVRHGDCKPAAPGHGAILET